MSDVETRRKCGVARARARFRIREELDLRGLNMRRLALQIGVCHQAVARTVSGAIHSPRVLQALREAGVPEKYLHDPEAVVPQQAAKDCEAA